MRKADTVIVGTVVTEEAVLPESCVAIADGRVLGLMSADSPIEAGERIEFPGCLILPGIVDAHVHARGVAGEGFTNITRAAAAGGVTTMIDMPGDLGRIADTLQAFTAKINLGRSEAMVDFALYGAATPHNLGQLEGIARAGAIGFKMFMSESGTLGHMDDGSLLATFQEIARIGSVAAVHAESFEITNYLTRRFIQEGRCGPEMHLASRPDVAEVEAVMRAVEYARITGVDLHLCHISLARSVDHAATRRLEHPRLAVESCPQYLVLSEETMERIGALGKINPPLRRVGGTEAMWERVRLGRVDLIGSDHSPHRLSDKSAPSIFDNRSGMPGVETMLPVLYSEGVAKRKLPVQQVVSLITAKPARRFGLYPRKGALLPGCDADLVVLDPMAEWEIAASNLHQAAGWTAYEGMRVRGKPILTMVRGRPVYRDGQMLGTAGFGRFVPPGQNSDSRGG